MLKKFFGIIFVGAIASLSAYDQADLDLVLGNPNGVVFSNLDLRAANLSVQDLSYKTFVSIDFRGAILHSTNFISSLFIDCIFVDADVEDAWFLSANFKVCNLLKMLGTCDFGKSVFDDLSMASLAYPDSIFDENLYPKAGVFAMKPNFKLQISGLCRRIVDEANKAIGR